MSRIKMFPIVCFILFLCSISCFSIRVAEKVSSRRAKNKRKWEKQFTRNVDIFIRVLLVLLEVLGGAGALEDIGPTAATVLQKIQLPSSSSSSVFLFFFVA